MLARKGTGTFIIYVKGWYKEGMTTETPLALFPWNWLEELDPAFLDLEGIPLSSSPKGFSLEKFEKSLCEKLKVQGVVEILDPIPLEEHKEGEKGIQFSVPGLAGTIALVISRSELEELLLHLLNGKREGSISDEYLTPFWNFIIDTLKGAFVESFTEANPPTIQQLDDGKPTTPALQYPLELTIGKQTFSAKMITSREFIQEWRKSNLKSSRNNRLADLLKARIEIPLDVVIGGIELPRSDWRSIEEGDILLLDHLTYNPGAEKRGCSFLFQEHPLFRIKAKTGAIKIIEQAKGVKIFMPLEPGANPEQKDSEQKEAEKEDEIGPVPEGDAVVPKVDRGQPESLHDLPLQIRIEMGRFKLPLNQVLELQEGNILKVDVDPRKGVDLVVEGKVIGRGELVQIGDLVGVRITDLK